MADSGGCELDVGKIMTVMITTAPPTTGTVQESLLVAQLIKDANIIYHVGKVYFFSCSFNYAGRYGDVWKYGSLHPRIFNHGTRGRYVVGFGSRSLYIPLIGVLVGPTDRMDCVEK